jgi:hypothetical protein
MTRIFAVALLVMSFASIALADGPDIPPAASTKIGVMQLADGPDIPPVMATSPSETA